MKKRIFTVLAYMLPTFPLGYLWHLTIFADYYDSLAVFRENIIVPFGVIAMLVQGVIWAIIYERMFSGLAILKGAIKFALIAVPIAWSFMVLAVSAKHHMSSVSGFLFIETAFILVHYIIVSPLIAAVYAKN